VPLRLVELVKKATTAETPKQANLPDLSWRL
jgi:hypothetical protein